MCQRIHPPVRTILQFLLLTFVTIATTSDIDQIRSCQSPSAQRSCGQCMKQGEDCAWCIDPHFKGYYRCSHKKLFASNNECPAHYVYTPHTRVFVSKQNNYPLGSVHPYLKSTVQLEPQRVHIRIKPGSTVEVPVKYLHKEGDLNDMYLKASDYYSNNQGVTFDFSINCHGKQIHGRNCQSIRPGDRVSFIVKVTLHECRSNANIVASIGVNRYTGVTGLYITPLCDLQSCGSVAGGHWYSGQPSQSYTGTETGKTKPEKPEKPGEPVPFGEVLPTDAVTEMTTKMTAVFVEDIEDETEVEDEDEEENQVTIEEAKIGEYDDDDIDEKTDGEDISEAIEESVEVTTDTGEQTTAETSGDHAPDVQSSEILPTVIVEKVTASVTTTESGSTGEPDFSEPEKTDTGIPVVEDEEEEEGGDEVEDTDEQTTTTTADTIESVEPLVEHGAEEVHREEMTEENGDEDTDKEIGFMSIGEPLSTDSSPDFPHQPSGHPVSGNEQEEEDGHSEGGQDGEEGEDHVEGDPVAVEGETLPTDDSGAILVPGGPESDNQLLTTDGTTATWASGNWLKLLLLNAFLSFIFR